MDGTRRGTRIWSERLGRASNLAGEVHAPQTRKGTKVPYIVHPLAVAVLVLANGGTEDEVAAALLHDVIEDGPPDARDRIRTGFGEEVLAIVEGCSDTNRETRPTWRARKEAALERLQTASPSVKLVVAADKLSNARDLLADLRREGPSVWSRFNAPSADKLWHFEATRDAIGHAPCDGRTAPILAELNERVGELRALAGKAGAPDGDGSPEEQGRESAREPSLEARQAMLCLGIVGTAIALLEGELRWVRQRREEPPFPPERSGDVDTLCASLDREICDVGLNLRIVRQTLATPARSELDVSDLKRHCELAAGRFRNAAQAWRDAVDAAKEASPGNRAAEHLAMLLIAAGPGIFRACDDAAAALDELRQVASSLREPIGETAGARPPEEEPEPSLEQGRFVRIRCDRCGRTAAILQAGTDGSSPGSPVLRRLGFLPTTFGADPSSTEAVLDSVERGDFTRPPVNRDTFLLSFHCGKCGKSYCQRCWSHIVIRYDPDWPTWYDDTIGTCPEGHRQLLDD